MKSIDCFDTLVTRNVFQPIDIFYFVGKKILQEGFLDINPEEFKKIRQESEREERDFSVYGEVSLDEIYLRMNKRFNLPEEILEKIKKIECDIELNSIFLIHENSEKLDNTTIVVSDIYHEREFINKIFSKFNLPYCEIFVSSEYRATKYTGRLYDFALSKYSIDTHTGDNFHSDVSMANKKGINSFFYKKNQPSRYERLIYESKIDYELKSLLSGVMKATRLEQHFESKRHQIIHEVSANVIAPFLFLYVRWILHKALNANLDFLFFVARDGQILYEIAKVIKEENSLNIELKYLFGSRKAWHLPAISDIDDEVLDWIFDPTEYLSVDDVFARVDINFKDVKKFLFNEYPENVNLNNYQRGKIKSEFECNLEIRKIILEKAIEKREKLVKYLKQQGFAKDRKIGIVDVGWRARQQKSLSKVLYAANIYPENGLHGYYLGLLNQVSPFLKDEYFTFYDSDSTNSIVQYCGLCESFVAADHGSCIGYTETKSDEVSPVLREAINRNMLDWGVGVQQKTIIKFSKNFNSSLNYHNVDLKNFQNISNILLDSFFKSPSSSEAEVYGSIKAFEDQEERKSFTHSRIISYRDYFLILKGHAEISHNLWVEGAIVNSFPRLISKVLMHILHVKRKFSFVFRKLKFFFKSKLI